ncbi:hypothetical protein [Nocardia amamiensis]|nr:hypothetical protein [Nocardia amamiensis]
MARVAAGYCPRRERPDSQLDELIAELGHELAVFIAGKRAF